MESWKLSNGNFLNFSAHTQIMIAYFTQEKEHIKFMRNNKFQVFPCVVIVNRNSWLFGHKVEFFHEKQQHSLLYLIFRGISTTTPNTQLSFCIYSVSFLVLLVLRNDISTFKRRKKRLPELFDSF